MANRSGNKGNSERLFYWAPNTAGGDCSHEIQRHLLLERKPMTNLESILESRDINNQQRSVYSNWFFHMLDAIPKLQNDLCLITGKPFNIMVIKVYAPNNNAEEAKAERFYEDVQDLLELKPKKRCSFHCRGLECKSRKSRNTWSSRHIWPWSTE